MSCANTSPCILGNKSEEMCILNHWVWCLIYITLCFLPELIVAFVNIKKWHINDYFTAVLINHVCRYIICYAFKTETNKHYVCQAQDL